MAVIQKTLPASCYTNQDYHELEQRAVFLRSWFFIGTVNKFNAIGDVHYEIAQVQFVARPQNAGHSVQVKTYLMTSVG
jgi:hypothetical protein